ncbi:MAG: pseudouridine synthase [Desulfurivibrionaceae bacterium]|nr:pseudouridine synthase [Desulfobulbales bacterium]MDT8334650.1 pseudouridine synthase [Desulfurivibrionaceae bacterium]
MEERLQKILAGAGICSRRRAEQLILAGRVKVDGRVITQLGTKVDPDRQTIKFDDQPLPNPAPVSYLLNKPRGYVTTMNDPQGRPLVTSLLRGVRERVFPVGRLDLDSEGALLLTNDGDLAQRILHPSHEIKKTYEATVKGWPAKQKLAELAGGIVLDGRKTWPARLRVLKKNSATTTIEVVIHEGRKRQVRLMFAAIGHPVLELRRTAYGKLFLGDLRPGKFRKLAPSDLKKIFT